jgi:hypothetical protein
MRQDHRPQTRSNMRYVVLVILGGITGVLLSRFLFPVVFERSGPFAFVALVILLVGLLLLARAIWRSRS